jgi:hypothetical protein
MFQAVHRGRSRYQRVDTGSLGNRVGRRRRLRKGASLAQQPQLGMNLRIVVGAHALHVGPQALLNCDPVLVERRLKLRVLSAHTGIEQRDAMLKRSLQIGQAAQKMNFVG